MIIVDSREKPQAIRGILAYFNRNGIEYEIRGMETGDYMQDGHPERIIDRKQSLDELARNLLSKDRARFYREVRRAHAAGTQLIILCECGAKYRDTAVLKAWRSFYGKTDGKGLYEAILAAIMAYGVQFYFCDKRDTGRRIVELLKMED